MTALRAAGATDVGMVRNNNEDQYLVVDQLYAVADGMGGHAAGEVAALTAVEALRASFGDDRSAAGLIHSALRANRAVWEKGQQDAGLRGMGTTLCALALVEEEGEERLAIINVGDSRAYRLHDGELEQLTEDHSLVGELVREGQISEDEAAIHPRRHVLLRSLGVDPDVEVDLIQLLPLVGDRFLLCSDGLTNEQSDGQIASVLRRLADPKEVVNELITKAKSSGGNDNITVVVVDVVDDDDLAAAASAALASVPAGVSHPTQMSPVEQQESPAEPTPAEPTPAAPTAKSRVITLRTVLFFFLLIAVLAGAALAVGVYARGSYFVGVGRNQNVTVFKGRPGSVLWFKPTVEHATDHKLADLLPQAQEQVKANKQEPSRSAADAFVARNLAPTTTTVQP